MKASSEGVKLCYYTKAHGWRPVKQGLDSLSRREREVLKLLAVGIPVTEIGKKLFLSTKTVSTYRQRVCDKLDLTTVPELIHYALHHGLIKNINELKEQRTNVLHLPRALTQSARRSYSLR